MNPRIHVITLAVADLDRALTFYRQLGLESDGVMGDEFPGDETTAGGTAAMFQLKGDLILSLYPDLAKDAGIPAPSPTTGTFSIGHLVPNRDDVDAVLVAAEGAGATLLEPPRERPWGIYSGYFRDLDGHLWEIIWNPQFDLPDD